ncbi:MAG: hypothetical protein GXO72_06130, partial [Caldiserica bacterium]|nr:hypothetical protein [Caldisericota bacterium]
QSTNPGRWGNYEPVIYDKDKKREYSPERDEQGKITKDYGLIIFGPNPFNPDKRLLLLAGVWGAGTLGATKALHDSATAKEFIKFDNLIAVISVPVIDRVAQRPFLELCRPLQLDKYL